MHPAQDGQSLLDELGVADPEHLEELVQELQRLATVDVLVQVLHEVSQVVNLRALFGYVLPLVQAVEKAFQKLGDVLRRFVNLGLFLGLLQNFLCLLLFLPFPGLVFGLLFVGLLVAAFLLAMTSGGLFGLVLVEVVLVDLVHRLRSLLNELAFSPILVSADQNVLDKTSEPLLDVHGRSDLLDQLEHAVEAEELRLHLDRVLLTLLLDVRLHLLDQGHMALNLLLLLFLKHHSFCVLSTALRFLLHKSTHLVVQQQNTLQMVLEVLVFGLLHELEKLVVVHELIEFGPIDQIDNLLRNDRCHKELSDKVHVTQNFYFFLYIKFFFFVDGHFVVTFGRCIDLEHNVSVTLKSVLNLLQETELELVLAILLEAFLRLQELAKPSVNIRVFSFDPGFFDNACDDLIHSIFSLCDFQYLDLDLVVVISSQQIHLKGDVSQILFIALAFLQFFELLSDEFSLFQYLFGLRVKCSSAISARAVVISMTLLAGPVPVLSIRVIKLIIHEQLRLVLPSDNIEKVRTHVVETVQLIFHNFVKNIARDRHCLHHGWLFDDHLFRNDFRFRLRLLLGILQLFLVLSLAYHLHLLGPTTLREFFLNFLLLCFAS